MIADGVSRELEFQEAEEKRGFLWNLWYRTLGSPIIANLPSLFQPHPGCSPTSGLRNATPLSVVLCASTVPVIEQHPCTRLLLHTARTRPFCSDLRIMQNGRVRKILLITRTEHMLHSDERPGMPTGEPAHSVNIQTRQVL